MRQISAILIICITVLSGCRKDNIFNDGVSKKLAEYRSDIVSDVTYSLTFIIPEGKDEQISATETLEFNMKRKGGIMLLDFRAPSDYLYKISVNGKSIKPRIKNHHIILGKKLLDTGLNSVTMEFRAGDLSLNRNNDYLYTLFVPDRACTAFPCFDQPDIKAVFKLTLDLPADYEAISNNDIISSDSTNNRKRVVFASGNKISTYLFAFTAGRFKRIEKEIDGFKMEMLHRETNDENIEKNSDDIFRLHYDAVRWLEEYTGIRYPFSKFGFVLLPDFQYRGMEHPGAIDYRASLLLLDKSPTLTDRMSRASLIAHETAHIWFGDLVTMKWFDDVWLKEVFAGFMSDKIVAPSFPTIDHNLRFLLSHYPVAYNVDRTKGTNPVIQKLDNLKDAGSLYGAIIYDKAPIIMKHLELITGEDGLKKGLQEYLDRYSYSNARWDDLITIMEKSSSKQLTPWSQAWTREAGMPIITPVISERNGYYRLSFGENDSQEKLRHWPQTFRTKVLTLQELVKGELIPGDTSSYINCKTLPMVIISDTAGLAYGCFEMNNHPINLFRKNIKDFPNPIERGVIYINAFESMFAGTLSPEVVYSLYFSSLQNETEVQLLSFLAERIPVLFWNRLNNQARSFFAPDIERFLWEKIINETDPSLERVWFNLFRDIAISDKALSRLYSLWESEMLPGDLRLSEDELCTLAFNLALREYNDSEYILARQYSRISNDDRREKFTFITPALSAQQAIRDAFFESLCHPQNREKETWVIEALRYLHHPLRAQSSEKYILPSLEMVEEIKTTGDIFFPSAWINATLAGHNTDEAHMVVESFLSSHRKYPEDLRMKILQAADLMIIDK